MPIITKFYGITVQMYFQQAEHNPPHIHVIYQEMVAAVDIRTGRILEGQLPLNSLAKLREWLFIYRKELLKMWNSQEFKKLPPLE